MLVSELIACIKDAVSTKDDLQNKTITPLFSNEKISRQLNFALSRYAVFTKGIEAYHSLSVNASTPSILLPSDVIRSEGIRFIVWFINGYAYPINTKNLNNTWGNFPVALQGIPRWANIWKDRINFYPQSSNGYNSTNLTADISSVDTTIPVVTTSGFPAKNGRFTIGNEIIEYDYTSGGNSFVGCRRGQEDTTAVTHSSGDTVNENNVWIYYYRLHFPITVQPDGNFSDELLNKEMLISDDHLEVIVKYTAYNLLSKIDTDRAAFYKTDWEEWLKQAKYEIYKGRSAISKGGDIRDPYMFETPTPIYRI